MRVETCEAFTNIRLGEDHLLTFYDYISKQGELFECSRQQHCPFHALEALLCSPEPDFFRIAGVKSWKQAFASLFLQRKGFIERGKKDPLVRAFWLPSHSVDKPSLEDCLQEVSKFLLAFASDFGVGERNTQVWLTFILEYQTITLGDLAHALLPKEGGNGVDPPAMIHPAHMVPKSRRHLHAQAAGDQTEEALRTLAGWLGILMIHCEPGKADPDCFPWPVRPEDLLHQMGALIQSGTEDLPTTFDKRMTQVLADVEFIREFGNLPILDQDWRRTFWQGNAQVRTPFKLSSVLHARSKAGFLALHSRKDRS